MSTQKFDQSQFLIFKIDLLCLIDQYLITNLNLLTRLYLKKYIYKVGH
jgi:hypothetical protein